MRFLSNSEKKEKLVKWLKHILWLTPSVGSKWKLKDADLSVEVIEIFDGKIGYSMLPDKMVKALKTRKAFLELYEENPDYQKPYPKYFY